MADPRININILGDASDFKAALDEAKKGLAAAGEKMKSAGASLTAGVTAPIAGIGIAAIKMAKDASTGFGQIATLLDDPIGRTQELKDAVLDMSGATGKSVESISTGLYNLISVYGDTADSAKILEDATKAAAAGNAEIADSINLTAAVTQAYGDTSAEAIAKVNDLAFQAVKLGKATFPELAQAVPQVTAGFKDLGVSQEEIFSAFAALTPVMANTAQTATALRAASTELIKPNAKMAEVFEHLGVASGAALIEQEGLHGAFVKIKEGAEGMGLQLGEVVGSVEAYQAISLGAGAASDAFAEKTAKMADAQGAAAEAFEKATGGVNASAFAMDQAGAKIAASMIRIGDAILPVVIPAIEKLTDLVADAVIWFTNLSGPTQEFIVIAAAMAAAVGPLLVVVGTLATVLSGPVVIGVGAAVAVIAGITALIVYWDEVTGFLEKTWQDFIGWFEGVGNAIIEAIKGAVEWLATAFDGPIELVKAALSIHIWLADVVVSGIMDSIGGVADWFGSVFEGPAENVEAAAVTAMTGITQAAATMEENVAASFQGVESEAHTRFIGGSVLTYGKQAMEGIAESSETMKGKVAAVFAALNVKSQEEFAGLLNDWESKLDTFAKDKTVAFAADIVATYHDMNQQIIAQIEDETLPKVIEVSKFMEEEFALAGEHMVNQAETDFGAIGQSAVAVWSDFQSAMNSVSELLPGTLGSWFDSISGWAGQVKGVFDNVLNLGSKISGLASKVPGLAGIGGKLSGVGSALAGAALPIAGVAVGAAAVGALGWGVTKTLRAFLGGSGDTGETSSGINLKDTAEFIKSGGKGGFFVPPPVLTGDQLAAMGVDEDKIAALGASAPTIIQTNNYYGPVGTDEIGKQITDDLKRGGY